jgi:hypothetical protein
MKILGTQFPFKRNCNKFITQILMFSLRENIIYSEEWNTNQKLSPSYTYSVEEYLEH